MIVRRARRRGPTGAESYAFFLSALLFFLLFLLVPEKISAAELPSFQAAWSDTISIEDQRLWIRYARWELEERLEQLKHEEKQREQEWVESRRALEKEENPSAAVRMREEAYRAAKDFPGTARLAAEFCLKALADLDSALVRMEFVRGRTPSLSELRRDREELEAFEKQIRQNLRFLESESARVKAEKKWQEKRLSEATEKDPTRWYRYELRWVRKQEAVLEEGAAFLQGAADLLLSMQKDLSHRLATLPLSRRLWETLGIFADIWNYEVLVFQSGSLTVGKILLSLLLVVLGIAFARRISRFLVSRIAQRVRLDRGGAETVQTFLFYALLILLFLVLLQVLQVPLTLFTLFGSAVALGVGFGTQNIINNFISGLILMIERPIKIGDVVEIENVRGVVDHIGARSTRIRTTDNLVLVLPNSNFLEKPVINWHLLDRRIRGSVKVGAAYGSDARLVEKKLLEAVAREERVLRRPTPQVLFRDFGADSLEFELLFWMEPRSVVEKQEMESRIRFSIDELFRECGITIAFPQRDVHLDTAGPIAVRLEGTPSSAAPS